MQKCHSIRPGLRGAAWARRRLGFHTVGVLKAGRRPPSPSVTSSAPGRLLRLLSYIYYTVRTMADMLCIASLQQQ